MRGSKAKKGRRRSPIRPSRPSSSPEGIRIAAFGAMDPGESAVRVAEMRHRAAGRAAGWVLVFSGALPIDRGVVGVAERILIDRLRSLEERERHTDPDRWAERIVAGLLDELSRGGIVVSPATLPAPRVGAIVAALREIVAVNLERSSIISPASAG